MAAGERAELATEEYVPLSPVRVHALRVYVRLLCLCVFVRVCARDPMLLSPVQVRVLRAYMCILCVCVFVRVRTCACMRVRKCSCAVCVNALCVHVCA